MRVLVAVFACAFASVALAAPPPAPTLTVAATDVRQLEFSWNPVSGAQSYELWFRSAPGAAWVKYREQPSQKAPLFRIGVSVHLLDWKQARYYVAACNTGGCTPSNQVGVESQALPAIGFIKPKSPADNLQFGNSLAASADGKTIAVLAAEVIGDKTNSAAIHVYRKTTSSSGWRREARLLPSAIQTGTGQYALGDPVALSADGNVLVFASWAETTQQENGPTQSGAVYVFRRSGSTWTLAQKIESQSPYSDYFGFIVNLDDAARTLVIHHWWPEYDYAPGTLEVYRDPPNDGVAQFVHSRTIDTPTDNEDCRAIALSGDGNTLLRSCAPNASPDGYTQVLKAPNFTESARLSNGEGTGLDISYDGRTVLVQEEFGARVWSLGSSGWMSGPYLDNNGGSNNYARPRIALSRDGKIAALGNWMEYTIGRGPLFPPYEWASEEEGTGGVMIWERKPSGTWVLRRLVKPGSFNQGWAGHAVALGDNGKLLVVGAPFDPSAATGINGDRDDDSAWQRGAVWLY